MMPTSKRKPVNEDSIEVWRLRAFDAPDPALIEEELEEEVGEKVVLPTAEEIEAMQEMARQEGHQEGYQAGYHEGYREGFSDGENQRKILSQISENFQAELSRLDEVVAAELTSFSLEIARRVLGFSYRVDEQLVTKMVEHAIQTLPASMEPTRVLMHPDDLAVVEKQLSEDFAGRKLSFIAEDSISRGGLKLMTATTDIDGTFETRWERVTASLDALNWQGLPNRKELQVEIAENTAEKTESVIAKTKQAAVLETEVVAEDAVADTDVDAELETTEAIQDPAEAEL